MSQSPPSNPTPPSPIGVGPTGLGSILGGIVALIAGVFGAGWPGIAAAFGVTFVAFLSWTFGNKWLDRHNDELARKWIEDYVGRESVELKNQSSQVASSLDDLERQDPPAPPKESS